MKQNARTAILDAALGLVGGANDAEITLDAAARAAGVTKPGLMYHFPTKEALMLGVVAHVADRWEVAMLAALGSDVEDSTPVARLLAYVEVACSGQLNRGDFSVFADAVYRPRLSGPWIDTLAKWFALPANLSGQERARLTVARLAADGLWVAEATHVFAPADNDRAAVVSRIRQLITEGRDS